MENNPFLIYNTRQPALVISEYGRIIQDYVNHILQIEDRDKRSRQAAALVLVMENLNPSVKEQADYKHKLWDHLHIIANFKLDVDSPYPVPSPEIQQMKPEPIPYPTQPIKFRFYGRNLQYMVAKAAEINDEGLKDDFVNLLASFMKNSSRSWNNEDLTNEMIANHLASMSQGKLVVSPESLEIKIDNSFKRKKNFKPNKSFSKYKKNNNYKNYR